MAARRTFTPRLAIACAVLAVGCTPQAYQAGYYPGQPSQQYLPPAAAAAAAQVPAIRQYYPSAGYPYPQLPYSRNALPQTQLYPYQAPGSTYRPPAYAYPPSNAYPPSSSASASQGGQPSEAELQMRAALLQRSMGFGGIFGPTLKNWMNTPEGNDPGHGQCSDYADYAACQAHKNGDDWAANRLQNNESSGAERDWYNR